MRPVRTVFRLLIVLGLCGIIALPAMEAGAQTPQPQPQPPAQPAPTTAPASAPGQAMAQTAPASPLGTVSLQDLGYNDIAVQGISPRFEVFFPGPGQTTKLPATFSLVFNNAPQLDAMRSAIRIEWNGTPVYTEALTAASATPNTVTRKIQIDASRVQPGLNKMSAVFLLTLPNDGSCPDENNPSRVATILQGTSVSYGVPVSLVKQDFNLGTFPNAFIQQAEPLTNVQVALPADPTPAELSAAAIVAGELTRLAPGNKFVFTAADPNTVIQPQNTHIVAIGSPSRNPLIGRVAPSVGFNTSGPTFVLPDGRQSAQGTGFLIVGGIPENVKTTVLAVTGQSDEAITNAARLFGNRQLVKTLSGPWAEAQQIGGPDPAKAGDFPSTVTLFPNGLNLDGAQQSEITQKIVVPPLDPASRVKVNLNVSRSQNLDLDLSFLRLTLNGQAGGGVQLKDVTPQGNLVTLDLPSRALKPGLNNIGLSAVSKAPSGLCASTAGVGANVYIHVAPSVTMELPPVATASPLSLALWPYPLIGQDMKPPTLVAGADGINAMLNAAAILGPLEPGDSVNFAASTARPEDPLPADGSRIIFGTQDKLPYRAAIQSQLPLELQGNVFTVRNQDQASAKVSTNSSPGVIELIGGKTGRTYIVTSADPANLDTAVRALVSTLPDTTAVVVNQDQITTAANAQDLAVAIAQGQGLRVQALTLPGAEIKTGVTKSRLSSLNLLAAGVAALAVLLCGYLGFTGLRRNEE